MNLDDPKLTAYALGELDEPERAEVEALLRADPAAAAEVAALRDFTARLRAELHGEKAPGLTDDQRAGVFAAARGEVGDEPRGGGAPVLGREETGRPVTNHFRTWLAMAACVAVAAMLAVMWIKGAPDKLRLASDESAKPSGFEKKEAPTQPVLDSDSPAMPAVALGKAPSPAAAQPPVAAALPQAPPENAPGSAGGQITAAGVADREGRRRIARSPQRRLIRWMHGVARMTKRSRVTWLPRAGVWPMRANLRRATPSVKRKRWVGGRRAAPSSRRPRLRKARTP